MLQRIHQWLNKNVERKNMFVCVAFIGATPFAILHTVVEAALGHYLPLWVTLLGAVACVPFMIMLMPPPDTNKGMSGAGD